MSESASTLATYQRPWRTVSRWRSSPTIAYREDWAAEDAFGRLSKDEIEMLTIAGMEWTARQRLKWGMIIDAVLAEVSAERVMSEAAAAAWKKRREEKKHRKAG